MAKPLVLVVLALAVSPAFACGDKLMLLVGNARFHQIFGGSHSASILAYAPENSSVSAVVKDLEPAVKQAGGKLFAVADSIRLAEALKTGKYDLVLADLAEAEQLEAQLKAAPSK